MSKDEVLKAVLEDILENITVVDKRFNNVASPDDFLGDETNIELFDSIVMRLQVLGELIKSIIKRDPEIIKNNDDIDWDSIVRMRDKISHHYADLDAEIIFDICKNYIPELKQKVLKLIK